MHTFRTFRALTLMCLFILICWIQVSAQNPPTVTNTVTENGYSIKKQVSNSSVPSGVVFTYTIFYTVPAGANNVVITDQVPNSLVIDNVVPGSGCGTPTVNVSGNLVSYALSSVSSGCSGTFQINVHFPAGITCPGTSARNQVCLQSETQPKICTEYISTQATAADPFKVSKGVTGLSWNPQNNGCQYIMAEDGNVTYNLMVYKSNPYQGNDDGQINLNNAVVTDVLPAGAIAGFQYLWRYSKWEYPYLECRQPECRLSLGLAELSGDRALSGRLFSSRFTNSKYGNAIWYQCL